jgi:hypothetical protein
LTQAVKAIGSPWITATGIMLIPITVGVIGVGKGVGTGVGTGVGIGVTVGVGVATTVGVAVGVTTALETAEVVTLVVFNWLFGAGIWVVQPAIPIAQMMSAITPKIAICFIFIHLVL